MSDEQPSPDSGAQALADSLDVIRQGLDALSDRLHRPEASTRASPTTTRTAPADTPPDEVPPGDVSDDRDVLAAGQEILASPSSGLDPARISFLAIDQVARLLFADRVMLFTLDADGSRLVPRAARGFRRDDVETISIKVGDGLVGQACQDDQIVHSSSSSGGGSAEDPFLALFPVHDAVAVPIRAAGHVAGVLYAGRRAPRLVFSEQDVLLLLVIADRVGTALAHHQFVETSGGHTGRLQELELFLDHMLVGREREAMLSRACELACRLTGARVAALGLPAVPDGLSLAADSGLGVETARSWLAGTGSGLTGEMFATHGPVFCRDIQNRDGCEGDVFRGAGMRACLVVPVRLRHQTVGALYLADPEPRDFTPDEVAAVRLLASLVALGMENDRMYGEVRTAFEEVASGQDQRVETEKARAVGAMAGGIANEFNNLLAIVLGKTQLMLARAPEGPLREGLAAVEEAAWRAADVVRRLQGLATTNMDDGVQSPLPATPPVASPMMEPVISPVARRISPVTEEPRDDGVREPATVSILVIEDEAHIRTLLVDALAGAGYRVETATDGPTGLARFQGEKFDVVLTDLSLPECSGLDVARSVKRVCPETPVVLITGSGLLLSPERLRDSGVDVMLVKPFRLDRLLAVLGEALRLRPSV